MDASELADRIAIRNLAWMDRVRLSQVRLRAEEFTAQRLGQIVRHLMDSVGKVEQLRPYIVASRAIVESTFEQAREACRAGMLADPNSDVSRLDLAALADAEGRSSDEVVGEHVVDRADEDPHLAPSRC
jgi:hypothetical protein